MARPSAVARSLMTSSFARELSGDIESLTAELTGAKDPAVVKSAKILVGAVRKKLSRPATKAYHGPALPGATASAVGQPPQMVKGRLRKSWSTAVVDGVRRVGSWAPEAPIQEFGGIVPRAGKTGSGHAIYPPRPYARPALEEVAEKMTDGVVSELQRIGGTE